MKFLQRVRDEAFYQAATRNATRVAFGQSMLKSGFQTVSSAFDRQPL
jgi:hypothetical protein